ncbi:MAG: hypothetical protein SNJ57_02255 [Cyanobacteriota bacterium]
MTEADLTLAKAFLLFSVAGYTITAANTQPHPRFVSQGVAAWADSVVMDTTGDRSVWVPSPIPSPVPSSVASSMLMNQSGDSSSFPLYLSQRPTLFSHSVSLTHAPKPNLPALRKAESFTQGFSGAQLDSRSDQPLTLPPALAEAGFQFRL